MNNILFHSDPVQNINSNERSTILKLIQKVILENDEFDVRDALPNVVPDLSSLDMQSEYSCPIGKVRKNISIWCSLVIQNR